MKKGGGGGSRAAKMAPALVAVRVEYGGRLAPRWYSSS